MSVLIVDDVETNLALLSSLLASTCGRPIVTELCPLQALELAAAEPFDLVLVDYMMPELDGIGFIRQTRLLPGYAETPIIMVTTTDQRDVRLEALDAGATDFVTKPIDPPELKGRVRNLLRLSDAQRRLAGHAAELRREVDAATAELARREEEIIFRLARAAEYRDPETGRHIARMASLSAAIARTIGQPEEYCREIYLAAPMHDVGKIGVSDTILLKPGLLTQEERDAMQHHAVFGKEILSGSQSRLIQLAADIALTHHEKWDGSGYPNRLAGDAIPLAGRIAAVADVYDALTSERPYKAAWSHERAMAHIQAEAGRHFDPACVAALVAYRVETDDEEEPVQRGSDHQHPGGAAGMAARDGDLSTTRDQRCDGLNVALAVRWDGGVGRSVPEGARR